MANTPQVPTYRKPYGYYHNAARLHLVGMLTPVVMLAVAMYASVTIAAATGTVQLAKIPKKKLG